MTRKVFCANCHEEVVPVVKFNWSPLSATNRKYICPHCEEKLDNKTDQFFIGCYLIIAIIVVIFLLAGGWKLLIILLVLLAGGA